MNINKYFQEVRERFSRETLLSPALDARLLIQAETGLGAEDFITRGDTPLTPQQIETIEKYITRRLEGEPVSRILGAREFWGLEFTVTPATLDPRPDTEILVERALARIVGRWGAEAAVTIADIGTGTGCILISLLHELPKARGVAVDLSGQALAVARENAARHGVAERIDFRCGSYLEPLLAQGGGESVDVLVSNPPYIRESDIANLAKDVRGFDPILALSGGEDGFSAYKILVPEGKKVLRCGGFALYEIGHDQLSQMARLVDDSHANLDCVTPDLSGIARVVEISYGDNGKNN